MFNLKSCVHFKKVKLSIKQDDVKFSGWAIESRIYAEDSARKFLPSIGRLTRYIEPKSKSIRVDSGVVEGSEISMYYDPMISKLCVFSNTRSDAIINMINALDRYLVNGVQTNKHFLSNIFQHKDFKSGNFTTKFIEENYINGFDSRKSKIINFDEMMAVATFVHFKKVKLFILIYYKFNSTCRIIIHCFSKFYRLLCHFLS